MIMTAECTGYKQNTEICNAEIESSIPKNFSIWISFFLSQVSSQWSIWQLHCLLWSNTKKLADTACEVICRGFYVILK